jgi:hypothetical protein
MPERNGIFSSTSEASVAYRDYLRLEKSGIEMVNLKMGENTIPVTLPYYLFTIGRELERLGQGRDALKLYLRLVMHYQVLDEENQIGTLTENRIHWLLGDKSWIQPTASELIRKIKHALELKNTQFLLPVISRDFGFGEERIERLPVNYKWAMTFFEDNWAGNVPLQVEVEPKDPKTVWLKVTGWSREHKIWYFVLHERERPLGWEWDGVVWGD